MSHTTTKKLKLNTSNDIGALNGLGNPVFNATFHNHKSSLNHFNITQVNNLTNYRPVAQVTSTN